MGLTRSFTRIFAVSLFAAATAITQQSVAQTYTASWLGNTFSGGSGTHVQNNIHNIFVTSNGTILSSGSYDEDSSSGTVYQNGNVLGGLNDFAGFGRVAGGGITTDGTYIYVGMSQSCDCSQTKAGSAGYPAPYGDVYYAIRRYSMTSVKNPNTTSPGRPQPQVYPVSAFAASGGSFGPDGSMLVINQTVPSSGTTYAWSEYGSLPLGMAILGNTLYVVDYHININTTTGAQTPVNQIIAYNTASLSSPGTVIAQLPIHGYVTQMVSRASDSTLWLSVISDGTAGQTPHIYKVTPNGTNTVSPVDQNAPGLVQPTALAFDTQNGYLMVADNGPSIEGIVFYDVTSVPAVKESVFGTPVLGGSTPGVIGAQTGLGLTGVGMDSSGNLTVSENGSDKSQVLPPALYPVNPGVVNSPQIKARMTTYNTSGAAVYNYDSEMFVDNAAVDPGSETDLYSIYDHFTWNYSSSPTSPGWTLAGVTSNPLAYPQDPRATAGGYGGVMMRRINGHPFLFIAGQGSPGEFMIYRFNGEIAVPSARIHYEGFKTTQPTNQPGAGGVAEPSCETGPGNPYVWTDSNGNGTFDSNEYVVPSTSCFTTGHMYGMYADYNGNVWATIDGPNAAPAPGNTNQIFEFPVASSLDSYGNPVYPGWDGTTAWPSPTSTNWVDPAPYQGSHLACSNGVGWQCSNPPLIAVPQPPNWNVTSASETGNGTTGTYVYTTSATNNYVVNEYVKVTGFGTSDFNFQGKVTAVTATTFTMTKSTTTTSESATCSGTCTATGVVNSSNTAFAKTPTPGYQTCAADFCQLMKAIYDPTTDMMYLTGNTAADENVGYYQLGVGATLAAYNNWTGKNGTRSLAWATSLPYAVYDNTGGTSYDYSVPSSVDIAGGLVFVGYEYSDAETSTPINGAVRVIRSGGVYATTMQRTAAMEPGGRLDAYLSVSAHQRSAAGDYIVTEEEDLQSKTVLFDLLYGVSTCTLSASPTTAAQGATITLTGTCSSNGSAYSVPTGTFSVNDQSNGSAPVCSMTLANGTGSCTTTTLASGTHKLSGEYAGDSTHQPEVAPNATVTIN